MKKKELFQFLEEYNENKGLLRQTFGDTDEIKKLREIYNGTRVSQIPEDSELPGEVLLQINEIIRRSERKEGRTADILRRMSQAIQVDIARVSLTELMKSLNVDLEDQIRDFNIFTGAKASGKVNLAVETAKMSLMYSMYREQKEAIMPVRNPGVENSAIVQELEREFREYESKVKQYLTRLKLARDSEALKAVVDERTQLASAGQSRTFVYDENKIGLSPDNPATNGNPEGQYANYFDLSGDPEGQKQLVWYRPTDSDDLNGVHGFVHRISQTTPWPLNEASKQRFGKAYAPDLETIYRERIGAMQGVAVVNAPANNGNGVVQAAAAAPADKRLLFAASPVKAKARSVQEKLQEDYAVLEQVVATGKAVSEGQKTPYYVYEEGKITVVTEPPKGMHANYFDLDKSKAEGQKQLVWYKPEDAEKLYGNHGFIHRLSEDTKYPLEHSLTAKYKSVYQLDPRPIIRAEGLDNRAANV